MHYRKEHSLSLGRNPTQLTTFYNIISAVSEDMNPNFDIFFWLLDSSVHCAA
jgi:hypothetical protein